MLHLEEGLGRKFHNGEYEKEFCCIVRRYREIKDDDKYTTLEISLDFGSLDKMKIKS